MLWYLECVFHSRCLPHPHLQSLDYRLTTSRLCHAVACRDLGGGTAGEVRGRCDRCLFRRTSRSLKTGAATRWECSDDSGACVCSTFSLYPLQPTTRISTSDSIGQSKLHIVCETELRIIPPYRLRRLRRVGTRKLPPVSPVLFFTPPLSRFLCRESS